MVISEIIQGLSETIRKVKGGYRLYSKKGKNLGTFDTRAAAEKHEREVQYFKHMGEDNKLLDRPTPSVKELAVTHGVDVKAIIAELKQGIATELEHTSDYDIAKEIALDHIAEDPKYYSGKHHTALEPDPGGYQPTVLTAPDNTLVINKSDDMDFYKLGQHYANIGDYDPHEIGVGPSDMTMTFANKEELMKMIRVLDRMGVAYKDISNSQQQPEIHTKEGNVAQLGIPANATDAELRKARSAGGKKGQRAHWLANMRRGKKK